MNQPDRLSSGDSRIGNRPIFIPSGAPRRDALAIFAACLVLYTLTNYGGIRSPDNEVVFRSALSFADHGRLDVSRGLEDWPGFGLARARDGRDYPVFGPVQSIALGPLVVSGRTFLPARWDPATRLPVSFYVPGGLSTALYGAPLRNHGAHALRFFCSFFNVVVAALGVTVFFLILRRLSVSRPASGLTAAFLAAGSLLWPYAGTFFSEPLSLLLLLLSFRGTLDFVPDSSTGVPPHTGAALGAGCGLGLAVATHLSAALFVPFFAGWPIISTRRSPRSAASRAGWWYLAGLAGVLAALGAYNLARFGNPFESGRGVNAEAAYEFGYGIWTAPWPGIYGLLLSPGKGLLLTCPAVLLGLLTWPAFHRRHRRLSLTLAAAALARLLFISCRSDWHGGFCVGPRYLVMLIPFLLLPIGPALDAALRRGRRETLPVLGSALVLCISQQFWFCLGEIFAAYHQTRLRAEAAGIDPFQGDRIYLDWSISPLSRLLGGPRGPFLLRGLGMENVTLWLTGSLLVAVGVAVVLRSGLRSSVSSPRG